jgi:hypothetical protein
MVIQKAGPVNISIHSLSHHYVKRELYLRFLREVYTHGTSMELFSDFGIDPGSLADRIQKACSGKGKVKKRRPEGAFFFYHL